MLLASKEEDTKSRKQLKQGLKKIFLSPLFLSIFQQTHALDLKKIHTIIFIT
jgi:hypothetical protein